ncbi:discoidin domain-containing protein [Solitalea lacus]|uniref:discoidin domain-containing protein n=1 Tax=Solitalea lacus TaxID=2911172 RepID=UPI001EDA40AD|nr:discoidin domain-containing protein [Solitalea lacus]UKJ07486.1 discoidin domain-containing protein [Solitalea lacus]
MKKLYISMLVAAMAFTAACEKDTAVIFQDKSTAEQANKTGWTATADSETPEGWEDTGFASALLDGNVNTIWHTNYDDGDYPGYPHWVNIDMKKDLHLISVNVTARQNNGSGMTKFKLEGSNDGTKWFVLGENLVFNPATKTPQTYPVSSSKATRYLKLTALEGKAKHTHLAEIDVVVAK